jgi:hypothetical protein
MSGDLTVSSAALALFTTMMTAVIGALVGMFWLAWREKDKSYQELKLQYDARYADMKAERDRLQSVQLQSDRDMMAMLGIIKDGVVGVSTGMASITSACVSMQQVVERWSARLSDRG